MYYSYMAQDFFHQCLNFLTFLKSKTEAGRFPPPPPPPDDAKDDLSAVLVGRCHILFLWESSVFLSPPVQGVAFASPPRNHGFPPPK